MADVNVTGVDVDSGSPTFGQSVRVDSGDSIVDSSGTSLIPSAVHFGARSTTAGSPVDWDVVDVNSGGFTGSTAITVPSAGAYFISTSIEGSTGASMGVTINVGGTVMASLSSNEGASGEPSITVCTLANITTPGSQAISITGNGFTSGGNEENVGLQIIKLSN